MPGCVGRTRAYSRSGLSSANLPSSLAPVVSRIFPSVPRRYAAASSQERTCTQSDAAPRSRSTRFNGTAACSQAARTFAVISTAYGCVASITRSNPRTSSSIWSVSSRPWRTSQGSPRSSSTPSAVAQLTVTACPSAQSSRASTRPSVVPPNIKIFTRPSFRTRGASASSRPRSAS